MRPDPDQALPVVLLFQAAIAASHPKGAASALWMLSVLDLVFASVIVFKPVALVLSADGLSKAGLLWSLGSLDWQQVASAKAGFVLVSEGRNRTRRIGVLRLARRDATRLIDLSSLDWTDQDLAGVLRVLRVRAPGVELDAAALDWMQGKPPELNPKFP